jgi:hypothetical protein
LTATAIVVDFQRRRCRPVAAHGDEVGNQHRAVERCQRRGDAHDGNRRAATGNDRRPIDGNRLESTLAINLASEDPPRAHEVGGIAQCRAQRGLPAALPDVGVVRERRRCWLLPAGSEQDCRQPGHW